VIMSLDSGGESEDRIAPVIPLFGGEPAPGVGRPSSPVDRSGAGASDEARSSLSPPADGQWRSTWDDDPDDAVDALESEADERTRTEREIAERNLTRKLRTRQLSVSEARKVIAERALDDEVIDAVLHTFIRRGYLDDRALAEQLVRAAVERKGQGRTVIAQTLAKRGLARDVIDVALAELPDDDAERALEFARQKVRAMRNLEHDVALRRLAGQLARRGYGAQALDAARRALAEAGE